jgi:hypothetical protein
MESYIGCKIIENKANNTVYFHQPKLIYYLKDQFGELVEDLKDFEKPAPPRAIDKVDTLFSPDKQAKFRSGTGMNYFNGKNLTLFHCKLSWRSLKGSRWNNYCTQKTPILKYQL